MEDTQRENKNENISEMFAKMNLLREIQKKEEENKRLEQAITKLSERRQLINDAIKQKKKMEDDKRRKALDLLMKQKKKMEDTSGREKETATIKNVKGISGKVDMLEAHKLLVDKSNKRILDRIEEIKLARQQEAMLEQERLVREQQLAISLIKKMKSKRKMKPKKQPIKRPKVIDSVRSLTEQLQRARDSVSLDPEDKAQVIQWMDLEKNAEILHKTDKAIAHKLKQISSGFHDDTLLSDVDKLLGLTDNLEDVTQNEEYIDDYEDYESYDEDDYDSYEDDYDYDYELPQVLEASHVNTQIRRLPGSSHVNTQVRRLPGGRVSTKVSIGIATPRPRMRRLGSHSMRSFSELMMHQK